MREKEGLPLPHRYIEEILNPHKISGGKGSGGEDGVDMGEDEGHEPASDIPPDRDKEEKPPDKMTKDVASGDAPPPLECCREGRRGYW